jgi:PhoD-like phosphatase
MTSSDSAPTLVLGPLLRHVDPVSATVWVETDRPCTVEVLGRTARTFRVSDHHYALVLVEGLEPGSTTEYEVHLDGERVWPGPLATFPPSRIRTPGRPEPFRLAFGSCRYATPGTVSTDDGIPPDALDVYAATTAGTPEDEWPDALVLLGDQVYADELTPGTEKWIAQRRSLDKPPGKQAADFEEYTRLYAESWTDPQVRWLLSTIPSSMIFDDHEMIDDWNTSAAWRAKVSQEPWWTERILGGLASYWIYQHLGNLSPDELAEDKTWLALQELDGDDGAPVLRELAQRADGQPESMRWSYVRHWGETRLVMLDSRAGRVLDEQHRTMLDDAEFEWVEAAMRNAVNEGVQHVVLGASLPWLLPHAIHDLERWNETLNVRHNGRLRGKVAEVVRQTADLEHWAAFGGSFERLGRALVGLGRGEMGPAPATALVLSGDVHHCYAAELVEPGGLTSRVHQLTVSPLHNQAPHPIRVGFRIGWSGWARKITLGLRRMARVAPSEFEWTKRGGPWFGNAIGELVLDGREARFRLLGTGTDADGQDLLREVADLELTGT